MERSALHLVAGRLLRQGPDREAPPAWGTGKGFQRGLELGDFGLRKRGAETSLGASGPSKHPQPLHFLPVSLGWDPDAPRLWRAGSQEGPAPAQSAAKPSAATSSASSEKFQGEWFVVGLAGSTHRKMDRFLLNPFTAVFEQNKNSRLEVSYAMIRGRRCVSWSYVLIPAAKPGAFSVDSREEPEEVQVYDTDYSVFALMLFRRQSGGQSVLRVTLLCAGPVGRQRRLPGPDRVVTPAGNLLKVDAAPPRKASPLLAARNKGSVSGSSRVCQRDLGGVGASRGGPSEHTHAHPCPPGPSAASSLLRSVSAGHCGSLRVPSVLPAWPPETRVHRPPHLPSPQSPGTAMRGAAGGPEEEQRRHSCPGLEGGGGLGREVWLPVVGGRPDPHRV
ncbi:epididymal-specific lipocalin-12 isoform X1 [Mustela putorius furo]|uniref:Epididymal-specific lipocalin-12 isoform X1 n=3 Tax=Mustela TaxID=9665 RepID=A0A8U0NUT9_MUSPF|nr:epididymal-specific lipocalin-12 isoform X1 [Mustela putorius furo]